MEEKEKRMEEKERRMLEMPLEMQRKKIAELRERVDTTEVDLAIRGEFDVTPNHLQLLLLFLLILQLALEWMYTVNVLGEGNASGLLLVVIFLQFLLVGKSLYNIILSTYYKKRQSNSREQLESNSCWSSSSKA